MSQKNYTHHSFPQQIAQLYLNIRLPFFSDVGSVSKAARQFLTIIKYGSDYGRQVRLVNPRARPDRLIFVGLLDLFLNRPQ